MLSIAQQFYHHGDGVSAVEPVARAVFHAKELRDQRLLRKSLNYQGIIFSSTNQLSDSIHSLTRALEIAEELGDAKEQCPTWNSLGSALYEAALYPDARIAFARSRSIASRRSDLLLVEFSATANEALCCLHLHEYEEGLERIATAVGLEPIFVNSSEALTRVFAEGTYTRLLLSIGNLDKASERADLAKTFSAQAKSVRGEISAACSQALVEVYSGREEAGIDHGMAALEKAHTVGMSLRETLLALVQALEKSGRTEWALALHREVILRIRQTCQVSIVNHRESQLKRLHLTGASQPLTNLLSKRNFNCGRD